MEESADTIYLVLPSEELSKQELDSVVGGIITFDDPLLVNPPLSDTP